MKIQEKLDTELKSDLEEVYPSFGVGQAIYCLKNYIDEKFKILEEKIEKKYLDTGPL